MVYKTEKKDPAAEKAALVLEPVVSGLGFAILELSLSRHRGSAQIRIVIARRPEASRIQAEDKGRPAEQERFSIGTEDLGRVHRAVLPRLESLMEGADFSVECSSPGIDRVIKEGAEFPYFRGRPIRCYLPAESRWIRGILSEAGEKKIILENGDETMELEYEYIAKAKLDG
ncbi:MAG: ribosome assembly cofactor RimP [Treponema sp.]|jgi:ribosome maturation factor RimP|nr:ribosome assembly cofactor RimP [Treponema sp.]